MKGHLGSGLLASGTLGLGLPTPQSSERPSVSLQVLYLVALTSIASAPEFEFSLFSLVFNQRFSSGSLKESRWLMEAPLGLRIPRTLVCASASARTAQVAIRASLAHHCRAKPSRVALSPFRLWSTEAKSMGFI